MKIYKNNVHIYTYIQWPAIPGGSKKWSDYNISEWTDCSKILPMEKSDCTCDSLFVAMGSLSMPLSNLSLGEIYSYLSVFLIGNSETTISNLSLK